VLTPYGCSSINGHTSDRDRTSRRRQATERELQ
jgi:hypothetical protein